ncbi:ParE-like toxin of type II ParDE toxin-antitoxin system [Bisgaardia hudsonensis]|uniref:ParE-like toxin of type II ParDE toxin-antitoxin system n=1 Tax=Bisgaardia hudsonensis TaxID=109472 RepID=A0A4R2N2Q7_9PAST|nr:type II toxin-antitoxin system RelE/ParE family toxin [Bisgaardia hudsonensis]QLB12554.1 hypothetical protein A6A11_02510 [Bisgaardia hudsonensis]TCP14095.1 ParE-like toxin of type II ParDE toxin-antitoxin system [Bisgaardia hudsonensis]
MIKVLVSPKVIKLINDYAIQLSKFSGYSETGLNFKKQCFQKIESLILFPERCRQYTNYTDFRELIVGDFLILYRYEEKSKTVYVANMKNAKQKNYKN